MKKNDSPLRAARLKLGLTLEALASKASCNVGSLSRIERGKQCPPDLAERLCNVIGRGLLVEMQVLYPGRVDVVDRHDVVIKPQANPQINDAGTASVTNVRSAELPTPHVRQILTPTLGNPPPKRIMIEGHVYRLERKAGT